MDQKNTSSRDIWETIITNLLGWGLAIGIILVAWSSQSKTGLQLASSPTSLPSTAFVPTMFVPTPDCGAPTLVIGLTTFQVQTITTAPDGSLNIPADTSGIAYWVDGTNTNYVFVLSPTQDNLTLQNTLSTEDLATIFWADCTVASFAVSGVEAGRLSDQALFDQSNPGISVFIQGDPSTAGFVIKGKLPEESIAVLDTPMPDESGVFAEVSLLDISTSPDGTTIVIDVSIRNYGQTAFTVSGNNVSITPEGFVVLEMTNSKPRLPEKISAGETEMFTFTFPRPTSPTAMLKIFTVEYDIEGY